MEEAHARVCERGEWALNEKRLLAAAGLGGLSERFTRAPARDAGRWVDEVARVLSA